MNITIVDDKLFTLGNVNYPRIYQAIPKEDGIRLQNIFERTQQLGKILDWTTLSIEGATPNDMNEAISLLNAVVYA